jgi:hypothetical protein
MSGAVFCIVPHTTSGASPTLAVDGLTARAINASSGVAIATGALVSGSPYLVKYVHASTEFILLNWPSAALTLSGLLSLTSTSHMGLPSGTTAQRPGSPAAANFRYNSSLSVPEYYTGSAWAQINKLPRGHIDGCILSNNGSDATNDIDIAAGVCRDSTNTVDMTVAAMTKRLDANWAAGTGNGLRNSAAAITDTTYHVYSATKADGTQDFYAHTSATVATVLTALQAESGGTDYLYLRRIGSIVRESGAIVAFTQRGDYFERVTVVEDVSATNPGTTSVTRTLSVPLGIVVEADLMLSIAGSSSSGFALLSALTATDFTGVAGKAQAYTNGGGSVVPGVGVALVFTNTSGQIRSNVSGSDANTTLKIVLRGWRDFRGKDA